MPVNKHRQVFAIAAMVLAAVAMVLYGRAMSRANRAQIIVPYFEAVVREGPKQGLVVHGELRLRPDGMGGFRGVLVAKGSAPVTVVGRADGRAVYLRLSEMQSGSTSRQDFILAVGLVAEQGACLGGVGGPFMGPLPASSGHWRGCIQARAGGEEPVTYERYVQHFDGQDAVVID